MKVRDDMKFDDLMQFKIDPATKADFQQAVDEDGETVSIVLRRLVREYLRNRPVSLTIVPASENNPKDTAEIAA